MNVHNECVRGDVTLSVMVLGCHEIKNNLHPFNTGVNFHLKVIKINNKDIAHVVV